MLACTLTLLAAVTNVIPGSEIWGKWEVYKIILAHGGPVISNFEEDVFEHVDVFRTCVPAVTYLPNGRVMYYLGDKLVREEFVRYERAEKYGVALEYEPEPYKKEIISFCFQIKDGILLHIDPTYHRDPELLRQGKFDPLARLLDLGGEDEDGYRANIYIMRRVLRHQPHKPAKRE